jgi:hypothetical protein
MPQNGKKQVWTAEELRNAMVDYVDQHEKEVHNGTPCSKTRISFLAFLCHSLGMGHPQTWQQLQNETMFYALNCPKCGRHLIEPAKGEPSC